MKINEIYQSIQGESSYAGLPCVFVRLTYCNLRCTYCDTEYAFYEGKDMTVDEILVTVLNYDCPLVEVTGGEPLLQKDVFPLMERLIESGRTVLLETGGSMDIGKYNPQVIKIVDLKCPSSGESKHNLYSNWTSFSLMTKSSSSSEPAKTTSGLKKLSRNMASPTLSDSVLHGVQSTRTAPACRLGLAGQSQSPLSTPNAQVHLGADATRRLAREAHC